MWDEVIVIIGHLAAIVFLAFLPIRLTSLSHDQCNVYSWVTSLSTKVTFVITFSWENSSSLDMWSLTNLSSHMLIKRSHVLLLMTLSLQHIWICCQYNTCLMFLPHSPQFLLLIREEHNGIKVHLKVLYQSCQPPMRCLHQLTLQRYHLPGLSY